MSTLTEINRACREGYLVFCGNRQGIASAVEQGRNMLPVKNRVWVNYSRTGVWESVEISAVTITNEQVRGAKMANKNVVNINRTAKRSGKRQDGRPGLPSEAAEAAAKKGNGKEDSAAEGDEAGAETSPRGKKWKPKSTVSLAKQGELPGVKTGERKLQEIETLAEKFEETKLAKAAADKDHKESDELLVAAMRRKKRTFYSRATWGSVSVPDPVVHARFKREKQKAAK